MIRAAPMLLALALAAPGCREEAAPAADSAGPPADGPLVRPPDGPPAAITVSPEPTSLTEEVVTNPGKGWLLFAGANDGGPHPDLPEEVLALGTCGYIRYNWRDLQPTRDEIRWALIDNAIAAWRAKGKGFAFRIMAANTHAGSYEAGKYVTPKWVFDEGAASVTYDVEPPDAYSGRPGEKVIPVWNDPVFKARVQELVGALAARYDGSPDLCFIGIGTYGNWGEHQNWPYGGLDLTDAELIEHMRWYREAFSRTPLSAAMGKLYTEAYDWAVENGIALRRDGLLGASPEGAECVRAYGKVPCIYEWHRSYEHMVELGLWSPEVFWRSLEVGRPSYQGTYWMLDGAAMYAEEGALMREAANRLGYHLVPVEATFPASLGNGQPGTLEVTWRNDGLAPIYLPAVVKAALLDEGGVVLQTLVLDQWDPSAWRPAIDGEQTFTERHLIEFARDPAGARLALGLFSNPLLPAPDIQLGVKGRLESGWFPLE